MNPWFSSFLKIFQNYCLFTLSGIVIQCWKFEGIPVNAAKLYTNIVYTRWYSLFCHSMLFKVHLHVLQIQFVLLPGYCGILVDRTWPINRHHTIHYKGLTSLYHLVVWCIQGGMLITTKLCSVKLLTLRGDGKLNLQKRIWIYCVSYHSYIFFGLSSITVALIQ